MAQSPYVATFLSLLEAYLIRDVANIVMNYYSKTLLPPCLDKSKIKGIRGYALEDTHMGPNQDYSILISPSDILEEYDLSSLPYEFTPSRETRLIKKKCGISHASYIYLECEWDSKNCGYWVSHYESLYNFVARYNSFLGVEYERFNCFSSHFTLEEESEALLQRLRLQLFWFPPSIEIFSMHEWHETTHIKAYYQTCRKILHNEKPCYNALKPLTKKYEYSTSLSYHKRTDINKWYTPISVKYAAERENSTYLAYIYSYHVLKPGLFYAEAI